MRMNWRPLIILLFFMSNGQTEDLWVSSRDTLIVHDSTRVIILNNHPVDSASVAVKTAGIEIERINCLQGKLFLNHTLWLDTVVVYYRYLRIDIPEIYLTRELPPVYSPVGIWKRAKPSGDKEKLSGYHYGKTSDFLKSGTIFRSVSLGTNSNMAIQSGIDLQLEGKISENIRISGVLSDQNTPIQPEGNTQTLDEIDKVFLRLQAPSASITMGDYVLAKNEGDFFRFTRKLTGIDGELGSGLNKIRFSGAVSRGEYITNRFRGEEGRQGPYILTGKDGNKAIIVIAGTERVWINGELQKRGEKNDYIIDYSAGELYFTPYKQITSDMRIAVEFEYSDLAYSRNIYTLEDKLSIRNNKFTLQAGYVTEGDNPSQPIDMELSDEDKKLLKQIGDDESAAFVSAVEEDSLGAYTREGNVFRYVGAGNGDYSLRFYQVGDRGTYRKIFSGDEIYFEYVDKGDSTLSDDIKEQATYLPARPVKLPTINRMAHIMSRVKPFEGFSIDLETALSDWDRNRFSAKDDKDNRGQALKISSVYSFQPVKSFNVSLSGSFRSLDADFHPLERIDEIEDARYWNRSQENEDRELRQEYRGNFSWKNRWNSGFAFGQLREGGGFKADRLSWFSEYKGNRLSNLTFSRLDTKSEESSSGRGNYSRQNLSLGLSFDWIKPFYSLLLEEKETPDQQGFRYYQSETGSSFEGKKISVKISRINRDNRLQGTKDYFRDYFSRQEKISAKLNRIKRYTSLFQLSALEKVFWQDSVKSREKYHTMDFTLTRLPDRNGRVRWNMDIKLAEEKTPRKEYRYFKVQEGYGVFRYDSLHADYVPDPRGDFILRIFPSEILEPVSSLENGFRIQINPSREKKRFLDRFNLTSQFRLEVKRKDRFRLPEDFFSKRILKPVPGDSSLFLFRKDIQHDLFYRPGVRKEYLHLNYKSVKSFSNEDVRGNERNSVNEFMMGLKKPFPGGFVYEGEMKTNRRKRISLFNALRNRDIVGISSRHSFLIPASESIRYRTEINFGRDVNDADVAKETSAWLGIKAEGELWKPGKGRGSVYVQTAYVSATDEIPFEMAEGFRPGINYRWGMRLDYRIRKSLSLILDYRGWKEEKQTVFHIGRAEIRAFF